ncbi:hypothetical protein TPHA_0L01800 [Tetrapisispora phaffii CBS 4417]|uniref:BRO domain-containing protein 1 n=1 Tax=Tetrapisispora phaffii (strain ATCC 24235 / CBS 4417 / NBRC 1672 / NRRL Y-8282 / UCD 70-5) TaxID=1071381 RepID=G8C055_TETPH|nr:hypothetical protein TPHA_0L01800 [Tetrapisispora phaffii CBS 4417]CCE65533.1 hypothetical protein TPHA_0L01800 [Tetrapisispora phaffii CBS 4417]
MKIEPTLILLKPKDTEKLKWKKALSNYLQKSYGQLQWKQFYDEKLAKDLDHLRVTANSDLVDQSLLELNYKYYAFIEHLYMRIGASGSKLNMDFTWYEASYSPEDSVTKHSQHSVIFEKACTLFNIGYLLIQIAKENLIDDPKVSISNLSKAAGCFEYISSNFLNSPSIDLNSDITKFLATVCHAEAQELFLMKLLKGDDPKSKSSLISKLSLCTSNMYGNSLAMIKDTDLKVRDYGLITWNTNIHFKELFYKSVSAYFHSVALEGQNKIGDAIAFSTLAIDLAKSSIPYKSLLKTEFDVEEFLETVTNHSSQLIKDNDYIYHEPIPSSVEITNIKIMDAIKVASWENQLEPYLRETEGDANVLFSGIVPMKVYEKESIYSEAKDNILRKEAEAIEMADLSFSSFVEFTNLPSLLNDLVNGYKTGNYLTSNETQDAFMQQQLESWVTLIRTSSLTEIEKQIDLISEKRSKIHEILKNLPESERENVVKLKTSLIDASQSDEKLFNLIKPNIPEIKLLQDENKLWGIYNGFEESHEDSLLDIDDNKNEKILEKINKVKELYENLRLLKEERSRNFQELQAYINEDDITSLIIKNINKGDSDLKLIFNEELQKFNPWKARIEATIYKQSSIINETKIELDDIFKLAGIHENSTKNNLGKEKKKEFFDKIRNAMANFELYSASISKGIQFYDGLLKMTQQMQDNTTYSYSTPQTIPQNQIPPPLIPKPNSIESSFSNLSMNNKPQHTNTFPTQSSMTNHSRPAVPLPSNIATTMQSNPPLPPKNLLQDNLPPSYDSTMNHGERSTGTNENNVRQNPTAFYDNPSVFNEELYSKFSK